MKILVYRGPWKAASLDLVARRYSFERNVPLGVPDKVKPGPEFEAYDPARTDYEAGKPALVVLPSHGAEILPALTVVRRIAETHPTKELQVLCSRPEWEWAVRLVAPNARVMRFFTRQHMQFQAEYRIRLPKEGPHKMLVAGGYALEWVYLRHMKLETDGIDSQAPALWPGIKLAKKRVPMVAGTDWPELVARLRVDIPNLQDIAGASLEQQAEQLKECSILFTMGASPLALVAAYMGVDVFLFSDEKGLLFKQLGLFNNARPNAVRYSPRVKTVPVETISARLAEIARGETPTGDVSRKRIQIPASKEAPRAVPRYRPATNPA